MIPEDIVTKSRQFIQKNRDLLNDKKYYEFAQKIKLMAHRKIQSKKNNEAIAMFKLGVQALLQIPQVQQNIPLELVQQLVQGYKNQPELLTKQHQTQFIKMLIKKPMTKRKIQIIRGLVSKTGKPSQHSTLANFYINYYISQNSFSQIQKQVAYLSVDKSINLVEKWTAHPQILQNQKPAIWCRMVLQRGIIHSVDDAQQLLRTTQSRFPNDDPYTVFTGLLLKATRISSKQAYSTIERSYEQFLKSDPIFNMLFNSFGIKYFGVEKKQGGLLGLIQ